MSVTSAVNLTHDDIKKMLIDNIANPEFDIKICIQLVNILDA